LAVAQFKQQREVYRLEDVAKIHANDYEGCWLKTCIYHLPVEVLS